VLSIAIYLRSDRHATLGIFKESRVTSGNVNRQCVPSCQDEVNFLCAVGYIGSQGKEDVGVLTAEALVIRS
jgi:hypothetical protein